MQRHTSGIERMIKKERRFHTKNSEKRVLAEKSLERRLRSQDLCSKLKAIMIKKVRLGLRNLDRSCNLLK
ncbi:ribosomal protein S21 family protein [Medicago truncatula]|uniref:Ribosomal protein S21 family protein n=1 Tax=Medicago truncatula TaxID=3880 RepID=A0A072UV15_MEDTR|nr:ribosomal protein S21 family protein [Medicago truncatula]